MKNYQFSRSSRIRLNTCHPDLQKVMEKALEISPVDFGIASGARTTREQNELFHQGRSLCDGYVVKSKHQSTPSNAVDIYAWMEGQISYSNDVLCFLGGYILATAETLLKHGKISHRIRWGGNWDGDGIIKADQTLVDLPHFELI